jgi:hypothetical protein
MRMNDPGLRYIHRVSPALPDAEKVVVFAFVRENPARPDY